MRHNFVPSVDRINLSMLVEFVRHVTRKLPCARRRVSEVACRRSNPSHNSPILLLLVLKDQ